jgi:hypothetical protein
MQEQVIGKINLPVMKAQAISAAQEKKLTSFQKKV